MLSSDVCNFYFTHTYYTILLYNTINTFSVPKIIWVEAAQLVEMTSQSVQSIYFKIV